MEYTFTNVKGKRVPGGGSSYSKTRRTEACADTWNSQQTTVWWTKSTSQSVLFQYRVKVGRLSSRDSFISDAGDLKLYYYYCGTEHACVYGYRELIADKPPLPCCICACLTCCGPCRYPRLVTSIKLVKAEGLHRKERSAGNQSINQSLIIISSETTYCCMFILLWTSTLSSRDWKHFYSVNFVNSPSRLILCNVFAL